MDDQLNFKNSIRWKTNPTEIERVVNTTHSQLEIWTDCLIGGENASKAYNLSYSLMFNGKFIYEAFQNAFDTLIERHESLRASFSSNGIQMNVYSDCKIHINYNDITQFTENEKEITKKNIIDKEVNTVFDLINGPLFKVNCIQVDELENIIVLTHHHIIGDGLSFNIILQELSFLYNAFITNSTANLPTAERFSEYANTINSFVQSNDYTNIEKFWINSYKESIPVIEMPIDQIRPAIRTYDSNRLDFPIDTNLINSLRDLGKSLNCSLTTTLLAAYEVFLSKITRQNDLIVGFPVSGNRAYAMKHMIGNCANLLPLHTVVDPNLNFLEYLQIRNSKLLEVYNYSQLSFGQLLQKLAISRDPSRIPMVPVTLTVDLNQDIKNEFIFSGLTYDIIINKRAYSSFEIHFHACRIGNGINFQMSYNTALFKETTIKQLMLSFEDMLNKVVAKPDALINDITKSDYTNNYDILNNTDVTYPNISLSELLSNQGEISPDNIALAYNDTKISYKDLHIKVNQFAHFLTAQGVKSGDYIAVSYPRSPELVYSILAIIQCGAAYLPLDHEYPAKRVEYMLNDSDAKFLLTSKDLSITLPKCSNTLLIEDAMASLNNYPSSKLPAHVDPENVLYLLYTSGSTGKPKGAKISNRNVVNLLFALENAPGINETDRVPFITTISFDIASFELFFPLFKGATLVLPDHETSKDGRLLYEMLVKEKISLMVGTTTTYMMLCDAGWSEKLPIKIWCCGEPLPVPAAKILLKRGTELWNLYGPTEVTIFSSCKQIKSEETLISVGGPISNMQYYIVDEQLNLLPPNTVGEIAIGGLGVGKGYLARPELTAEKFMPNKFSNKKGDIMYLSGDIGKLLPSNEVVCLGRVDHQVKVRGHRIEIGEIEQALLEIEVVKYAIVLAKTDILIAFITTNDIIANEQETIRSWRNALESALPAFMIPHEFHIIEEMPRTLNDKIDRTALLQFEPKTRENEKYNAPRTAEEVLVAEIWEENLKKEQIDIFSNFFEIGGHSLIAVTIVVKIQKKTGVRIPLSAILQNPTIEKFAKLLIK